jgi:hypothetical protein
LQGLAPVEKVLTPVLPLQAIVQACHSLPCQADCDKQAADKLAGGSYPAD